MSIVIIGAGHAGLESAAALRSRGFRGPITLVGDEPEHPYQRPPLSKDVLKGTASIDSTTLRPLDYYASQHVELILGSAASGIDRRSKVVELSDRSQIGYEHLVLATGARNRRLAVPGAGLPGVFELRTLRDSAELAGALRHSSTVAIVGAGFIGLEVAAAAQALGATVTVIESTSRPMARTVSPTVAAHFVEAHRIRGVDWRFDTTVAEITARDGHAAGVRTDAGDTIAADIVVVGIGVLPNTALAHDAGLAVHDGIIVDDFLQTPDPDISAVGDCASFPGADRRQRRLESLQNAADQARCLADRLTGRPAPYTTVPWFWTDQYDLRLQIAGLYADCDQMIVRGRIDSGSFSAFCFAAGDLVCVESVNRPRDHIVGRKLLNAGIALTTEQAADDGLDLKTLL